MKKYLVSVMLFLSFCSPVPAADAPDETLKIKLAPEFKIDIVKGLKPIIEKNYWTIQSLIAIYLAYEFFLAPYFEQLEELTREERAYQSYKANMERRERYRREKAEERAEKARQEQEERELEREAEELTTPDNWDYFSADYD